MSVVVGPSENLIGKSTLQEVDEDLDQCFYLSKEKYYCNTERVKLWGINKKWIFVRKTG